MTKNYDDIGGVWRTIGGRRVFIKTGQSLSEAMKESGKFKKQNKVKPEDDSANNDPRDEIMYYLKRGDFEKAEKYMEEYGLDDEKEMFMDGLRNDTRQEYHNYLRQKNNKGLNENKKTEAQKYYEKLNEKDIANDLEERKKRLNNNFYDEKDKEKYQKFYEDGKKYYDEKYKKELYPSNKEAKRMYDNIKNNPNLSEKDKEEYYKIMEKYTAGPQKEGQKWSAVASRWETDEEFRERILGKNYNMEYHRNKIYKKAFEEYKKKHPNTKLNLQRFIEMSEE